MTDHISDGTSESEQMYLLTIARMAESDAHEPVPINLIAEKLCLQPVSVHQMIHKLEQNGLVSYYPYKGVLLTPAGENIAYTFLRFHRLWEVFLTDHLGFSTAEASDIACDLEHASSEELATRLDKYLKSPIISPTGKPIPTSKPEERHFKRLPVDELSVGRKGVVLEVEADDSIRTFLQSEGVFPGAVFTLLGTGSTGVLLEVGGRTIRLGQQIASCVSARELEEILPGTKRKKERV
jgi:DtxR family transcriptional regulator, Mn-dependent transcriptional regulator